MNLKIKYITTAAMIAAIYSALTIAGYAFSYGPVQFRFSEALMILPILTPAAIPGLTIGCVISNWVGPYGVYDIILGSFATFLAAVFAYKFRKLPYIAPLGAVVFNAFIVGALIYFFVPIKTVYLSNVVNIGLGELVICYVLGLPLYFILKRTKLFN